MSRILFWIVLFGAIWWFWRRTKTAVLRAAMQAAANAANGGAPGGAPGTAGGGRRVPAQLAEPMVPCAYCGAHSPRSETIGLYRLQFCNAEHARLYASGERTADPQ